jgi:hypothetical protein
VSSSYQSGLYEFQFADGLFASAGGKNRAIITVSGADARGRYEEQLTAYDPDGLPIQSQDIRDSMKLAATAGSPASGSVDAKLDATAITGAAMTLTTGERTNIATALLDLSNGVETSFTVRQVLKLLGGMAAGKTAGFIPGSSGTGTVRNLGDSLNRMSFNYDAQGNITSVTLNLA